MPKYYTQCEGTPTTMLYFRMKYATKKVPVYRYSSPGYLFYNHEGIPDFTEVHQAMWTLSRLYPDARGVFSVRVDKNTIFASFNTDNIIRPIEIDRIVNDTIVKSEWIEATQPKGWLVDNINDVKEVARPIDYDEIYSNCLTIERMAGMCPCFRAENGACEELTLAKALPRLRDDATSVAPISASHHQNSPFSELFGFQYISGMYTTTKTFTNSLRPWDDYNFAIVPFRQQEYANRGKDASRRAEHRKDKCVNCIFGRKLRTRIKDCGGIDKCATGVTNGDIQRLLHRWVGLSTPYFNASNGFTKKEIAYLMSKAGTEIQKSNLFGRVGIPICFAGFRSSIATTGGIYYQIAPLAGELSRRKMYTCYKHLYGDFTDILLPADEVPDVELHSDLIMAHAIFSLVKMLKYSKRYSFHSVRQRGPLSVELWVHNDRKIREIHSFTVGNSYETLYQLLWPGEEAAASEKLYGEINNLRPYISYRLYNS